MSNNVTLLAARALLALIFILSGVAKFGDLAGTAGYISSVGLPFGALLAPAAALFEVVAGLAILAGFLTRYAAYALALFSVAAGFLFHFDPADQMQFIMLLKNIAIAGGFLALAYAGPGEISIDAKRGPALAIQS